MLSRNSGLHPLGVGLHGFCRAGGVIWNKYQVRLDMVEWFLLENIAKVLRCVRLKFTPLILIPDAFGSKVAYKKQSKHCKLKGKRMKDPEHLSLPPKKMATDCTPSKALANQQVLHCLLKISNKRTSLTCSGSPFKRVGATVKARQSTLSRGAVQVAAWRPQLTHRNTWEEIVLQICEPTPGRALKV